MVQNLLTRSDAQGFNEIFAGVAAEYSGVTPIQVTSSNLILGRIDPASVVQAGGPSFLSYPMFVLSPAKSDAIGNVAMKITPSTFSGVVGVSLDAFIKFPGGGIIPDGNALGCAFEDTIVSMLNEASAYSLYTGGLIYNNEVSVDFGKMEWATNCWTQCVMSTIVFRLVA
jgi:hypothetical protein